MHPARRRLAATVLRRLCSVGGGSWVLAILDINVSWSGNGSGGQLMLPGMHSLDRGWRMLTIHLGRRRSSIDRVDTAVMTKTLRLLKSGGRRRRGGRISGGG